MSSSDPIYNQPKDPYNETPENIPLEELVPGSICAHDRHSHHRHKPGAHNIHAADKAEERGWHDSQRTCPIVPDDPIDLLSSFQQEKHDVVRGLGTTDYCRRFDALECVHMRSYVGGVYYRRSEAGLLGPDRLDRVRSRAGSIDEFLTLDHRLSCNSETPSSTGDSRDIRHSCLKADPSSKIKVPGEVVQVGVDSTARDIVIVRHAFVAHRIKRVFKQAMLHLSIEIGIDLLGTPDTSNRSLLVENKQVCGWLEVQVGLGTNKAIDTYIETISIIDGGGLS